MSAGDDELDYLHVPLDKTDRLLREAEEALSELVVDGADPSDVLEPLIKAVREIWRRSKRV